MLKRAITPKTINAATTIGTGLIGLGLLTAGYRSAAKAEQALSNSTKQTNNSNSIPKQPVAPSPQLK